MSAERPVLTINLRAEYDEIKDEIVSAAKRVFESGWYILGNEIDSFEKEFADYLGVGHVVGVASGTDAITLSLKALGIDIGDGVVVPANVYPSSFGVYHTGASIQLVDVDPRTLNLSVSTLERVVDRNTKAVLAVHLYGNPVDLGEVADFCKLHKIALVEDCAQATGAIYKEKKVGSFGSISCFSFYPTKTLGAYGDGGAVATNDENLAEKIRMLRMYGEQGRYNSVLSGHNSRLDELQAALLRVKLKHVGRWNQRRRWVAQKYKSELTGLPIEFIKETNGSGSVYHLFVIRTQKRDELALYLKQKGIGTGVHYPTAIHLTESFETLGYKEGDFPVSEEASKTVLSLPCYPQMKEDDVEYVIRGVKGFFGKAS